MDQAHFGEYLLRQQMLHAASLSGLRKFYSYAQFIQHKLHNNNDYNELTPNKANQSSDYLKRCMECLQRSAT